MFPEMTPSSTEAVASMRVGVSTTTTPSVAKNDVIGSGLDLFQEMTSDGLFRGPGNDEIRRDVENIVVRIFWTRSMTSSTSRTIRLTSST